MANGNGIGVVPPGGDSPPPSSPRKLPPLPVIAVIVGGGIGGAVFLARKLRGGQVQGAQGTPQQILPSVPIMLGSLQQSILDLQGSVGSGFGGLTDTMSVEQATLAGDITSAQNTITSQISTLGSTLQGALASQQQAYTDALSKRSDTLQSAIDALGTQISNIGSGQDALKQQLTDAQSALKGQLGDINSNLVNLGQGIQTVQGNITNIGTTVAGIGTELTSLQGGVASIGSQLTGLGGELQTLKPPEPTPVDYSAWNGQYIYGSPNGDRGNATIFKVIGGKLYGMTWSGYQHDSGASSFLFGGKGVEVTDPAQISYLTSQSQGVIKAPGQTANYG